MVTNTASTELQKWALILTLCLILQFTPLRAQTSAPFIVTGTGVQFEFQSDGTLVSQGSVGVTGSSGLPSGDQGSGTRLLWWPYLAAFRAGYVEGPQWDVPNIGFNSVAFGFDTIASNNQATAFGIFTTASGYTSTAFGWQTTASGNYSMSSGEFTTASGNYSSSFGEFTAADAEYDFVIGYCNVGGGTAGSWASTEPLFEIGNGSYDWDTSTEYPHDALVVYKNGNATLSGTLTVAPGGDISMGSFTAGTPP